MSVRLEHSSHMICSGDAQSQLPNACPRDVKSRMVYLAMPTSAILPLQASSSKMLGLRHHMKGQLICKDSK